MARSIDEQDLEALGRAGMPFVVIKRRVPESRASCVITDDAGACAAATGHLLDLGHSRVGLLLGPMELGISEDRWQGYISAHLERGLTPDPELTRTLTFPLDDSARPVTRALLTAHRPPTAIVAASDHIALGVYQAIRDEGMEPGRDIAVTAVGDGSFGAYMHPSLTMVVVPIREMGRQAADLLIQQIRGTVTESKTIVVPWELRVRESRRPGRPSARPSHSVCPSRCGRP